MSVIAHADEKYRTGSRLRDAAERSALRVEFGGANKRFKTGGHLHRKRGI
jgi:hypothetical protein